MSLNGRRFAILVAALLAGGLALREAGAVAGFEQLSEGEQRLWEPDDGYEVEDGFGAEIAMEGDWAVVGAPEDDVNGVTDAGSACFCVFKKELGG